MDPDDLFGPDAIIVDLLAQDRWQAIDELLGHLAAKGRIKAEDKEAIAESVKKREKSMSTAIGSGIAIPHASTDLVSELVGILGRSRAGIQFGALDAKPVKTVFLFLVPGKDFQKHLKALTNIAKALQKIGPGGKSNI